METSLIIALSIIILIIGILIYMLFYPIENFSPLDSQLDNADIFIIVEKNNIINTEKQFDKLNLNYRLYKKIDDTIVDMKSLVFQGVVKIRDTQITQHDYAQFLSNVNIWKIFLESSRSYCVVLNDKIKYKSNFKQTLSKILDDFSATDLDGIVLNQNITNKKDIKKLTKHINYENNLGNNTSSYILTKEGVRKMINNTIPIVTTMQNYFDMMNAKNIAKIGKLANPIN